MKEAIDVLEGEGPPDVVRFPRQSLGKGRQKSISPQGSGCQKWRPHLDAGFAKSPPRTLRRDLVEEETTYKSQETFA